MLFSMVVARTHSRFRVFNMKIFDSCSSFHYFCYSSLFILRLEQFCNPKFFIVPSLSRNTVWCKVGLHIIVWKIFPVCIGYNLFVIPMLVRMLQRLIVIRRLRVCTLLVLHHVDRLGKLLQIVLLNGGRKFPLKRFRWKVHAFSPRREWVYCILILLWDLSRCEHLCH